MPHSPIFILGTNRSGTTLLRLMLNAHSRIAVPEEMLYFRSDYRGARIETWRNPDLSVEEYTEVARSFVSNAIQLHGELGSLDLTRQIVRTRPHDLRRPYATVMDAWATLQNKPRWGEKTPGNIFYVDIIYEMFPDARFIYIARDPRAGVSSMERAQFFPGDVVFNSLSRRKHFTVARRLLREYVPADQWMEMRYEDLVREPEATLHDICRFLNEPFEPEMLLYHLDASDYMKEDAASSFNAAATRPISTNRLDAWQKRLSRDDVAIVESICKGEMGAYGYEPDGHSPSFTSQVMIRIKTAYWHLQLWRHRSTRHYTVKYPMLAGTRERLRRHLERLRTLAPAKWI